VAGLVRASHVISSDRATLHLAEQHGAEAVQESEDAGVNQAVAHGLAMLKGQSAVLVLPADLPTIRPTELEGLVAMHSAGLDVVICPSRGFNGTNALLFSPRSAFPLSYDDNSFWNHIAACGRLALSVGVSCEEGLMFDVDTPEDFRALASSRSDRLSALFARKFIH
jgi:2-phospho-L-lactate guanylyltransferase